MSKKLKKNVPFETELLSVVTVLIICLGNFCYISVQY